MNVYRHNVLEEMRRLLAPLPPATRALDVGSGDGWFAQRVVAGGLAHEVVPVDVQRRDRVFVEPRLYDGRRLPFEDRAFPLVYSVDVLHHAPEPVRLLEEVLRCADRYVLLKDHTYHTAGGYLALCALDELGNRRFGIPSRYRYQRDWEWFPVFARAGFSLQALTHPARCGQGPMRAFDGLQFVALWERQAAPATGGAAPAAR